MDSDTVGPALDWHLHHRAAGIVLASVGEQPNENLDIEYPARHERLKKNTAHPRSATKHLGAALCVVDRKSQDQRHGGGRCATEVVEQRAYFDRPPEQHPSRAQHGVEACASCACPCWTLPQSFLPSIRSRPSSSAAPCWRESNAAGQPARRLHRRLGVLEGSRSTRPSRVWSAARRAPPTRFVPFPQPR